MRRYYVRETIVLALLMTAVAAWLKRESMLTPRGNARAMPTTLPALSWDFTRSSDPVSIGWAVTPHHDAIELIGVRDAHVVLPDGRVMHAPVSIVQVWQDKGLINAVVLFSPPMDLDPAYHRAKELMAQWGLLEKGLPSLDKWYARKQRIPAGRVDQLGTDWDGVQVNSASGVAVGIQIRFTFSNKDPWTVEWAAGWNTPPTTQPASASTKP